MEESKTRAAPESTEWTKLQAKMPQLNVEQKASLGSMLGAFVGDSLGSYVEFQRGEIDERSVNRAMAMPGGGCW